MNKDPSFFWGGILLLCVFDLKFKYLWLLVFLKNQGLSIIYNLFKKLNHMDAKDLKRAEKWGVKVIYSEMESDMEF
jgi:hypothetical protein